MLKNCFCLPKLLYFLRTCTCSNHPALLEKYDKTVRDGLPKVCNVNFNDTSSTQLALPAEMGGLGVSSTSLLALPAFLTTAFGASDFLATISSGTFENVSFTKALEKWVSLTNAQESPLDGTQRNRTQPVFVKTAQDLVSRIDDKRSKFFNAPQGKLGSQWVNVVPCKNLGLKLDDQQFRISIGLRLGVNICVAHTCHCGKRVQQDGFYGLSCTKSAGRFSRHATLNSLKKQTLGSLDSWCGMSQLWMLLHRLNQGSLCKPRTTAIEAEARKTEKYPELIDNGYIFQPVAFEVQGSLGKSS